MKWNRNDRGQAVLEFAMVLPLFLLVMVGTAEVGILVHDYLVLHAGIREGARVAATGSNVADIQTRVYNTSPTLNAADLTITVNNAEGARGTMVTVNATYTVDLITPMIETLMGQDPFPLSTQVTMRLE